MHCDIANKWVVHSISYTVSHDRSNIYSSMILWYTFHIWYISSRFLYTFHVWSMSSSNKKGVFFIRFLYPMIFWSHQQVGMGPLPVDRSSHRWKRQKTFKTSTQNLGSKRIPEHWTNTGIYCWILWFMVHITIYNCSILLLMVPMNEQTSLGGPILWFFPSSEASWFCRPRSISDSWTALRLVW